MAIIKVFVTLFDLFVATIFFTATFDENRKAEKYAYRFTIIFSLVNAIMILV